ncbi:transforming acidic coiled-coil-containing protein 3-like isoform X1 [Tigriopus californicus]|uniref:transforming acidic coiled-coil-containing protein 3-like isoform X1 n=1 Tax=Tigriopus californicus TaxID=6832 RepID=UPI0027DA02FD|nr:transforming acidic coiled-coil-containing protein 3-like isoform X1 [Tigriopus californicus]
MGKNKKNRNKRKGNANKTETISQLQTLVQDPENKENDAGDLIQGSSGHSFKGDSYENHPLPADPLSTVVEPPQTSLVSDAAKYEAIASLDADPENEEEKWSDRTAVITKIEHEDYTAYAQDILIDILKDVKTPTKGSPDAKNEAIQANSKENLAPQAFRNVPSIASYESDDSFGDYASAEQSFTSVVSTTSTIPLFTASASLEDLHQLSDDQLDDIKIQDETMGSILDAMTNLKIQQRVEVPQPDEDEREATPINDETLMDTTKTLEETLNGTFAKEETPTNVVDETSLDKTFEKQGEEDAHPLEIDSFATPLKMSDSEKGKPLEQDEQTIAPDSAQEASSVLDEAHDNEVIEAFDKPNEETSVTSLPETTQVLEELENQLAPSEVQESSVKMTEFNLPHLDANDLGGAFSISFGDEDKPKKKLAKKPVLKSTGKTFKKIRDPITPNQKDITGSPKSTSKLLSVAIPEPFVIKFDEVTADDPFKASNKMMNSPPKQDLSLETIKDPFQTNSKVANSPTKETIEPFKIEEKVANLPPPDTDAFEFSTTQSQNDGTTVLDGFVAPTDSHQEATVQYSNEPTNSSLPLKTDDDERSKISEARMTSSSCGENADMFKSSVDVKDSPSSKEVNDAFEASNQTVNLPVAEDVEDPFKSSNKIPNSPGPLDMDDPFKSSNKMMNSPIRMEMEDPFKSSSKIVNSPGPIEIEDPFKSSSKVSNSPEKVELEDPFKPSSKIMNSPGLMDMEDPFKPSSKIANSPGPTEIKDPFKSSKEIPNSPEPIETEDPFKSSNKMANTPEPRETESTFASAEDVEDPLKSSNTLMNTLNATSGTNDPLKPSTTLADSPPSTSEEISPVPKQGPTESLEEKEMNPFQSKSKIINSPDKSDVLKASQKLPESHESEGKTLTTLSEFQTSLTDLPQSDILDLEDPLNEDDLPDLVKINPPSVENLMNNKQDKSGSGRFSTPEFEADEKRLKDEEDSETTNKVEVAPSAVATISPFNIQTPSKESSSTSSHCSLSTPLVKSSNNVSLLGTPRHPPTESSRNIELNTSLNDSTLASPSSILKSRGEDITDMQVKEILVRNELLWQQHLLDKDREMHDKETKIKSMEQEIILLSKENEDCVESNRQMMIVVEEYEKTISEILSERERDRVCHEIEKDKLTSERNQIFDDLRSAERSFNDVHRKYERTKEVISGFKQNEDSLKSKVSDLGAKLKRSEDRYDLLRNHAESKLAEANERIESLQQSSQANIARLQAQLRKAEMHVTSLERTVEQKTRDNEELTKICDELIANVGS